MGNHKKNKIQVHFIGDNAEQVTGSEILITFKDISILLESGLAQSNSSKEDYRKNSAKLKYRPSDIDYIFVNHVHIDHCGKLPRLYAQGCDATIFTPHDSVPFFYRLLDDSAYIMARDANIMSRTGKKHTPIYTSDDVKTTCSYIRGYDYHTIHKINDTISFSWTPSGHIIGSGQLTLFLTDDSGFCTKLLYTSDLGNTDFKQYYVTPFEPVVKAEYVISEATYGSPDRKTASTGSREKDIEKIETAIRHTCENDRGRVLFPVFSLQRTQTVLTMLYEIFGKDKNFDFPVYIDSPLAVRLTRIFEDTLTGKDKQLLKNALEWENVRLITNPKISMRVVKDQSPKIVLSSSGMGNAGRVKHYIKEMMPRFKDHIIFTGFSTEGSLSHRIRSKKHQKTINIDGKPYQNKCNVSNITSFSGHMQHNSLKKYLTSIKCKKIFLVHSDQEDKIKFKRILEEEFSKQNKTIKVVATNKGTVATLN